MKKVGFGVGATMLGSVGLPAVLTTRLHATERCTTTCTTPPPSIPPKSAQDTHNSWHVPLFWNANSKLASASEFGSSANAAASLGYYIQNDGWFTWLNQNVTKYSLPTSTQINSLITVLQQWGTPFSYSQMQAWTTVDKTTLVSYIQNYGSASLWNGWVNAAQWFSTQNMNDVWNRIVHPTAGTCANMSKAAEFAGSVALIFFVIPVWRN